MMRFKNRLHSGGSQPVGHDAQMGPISDSLCIKYLYQRFLTAAKLQLYNSNGMILWLWSLQ